MTKTNTSIPGLVGAPFFHCTACEPSFSQGYHRTPISAVCIISFGNATLIIFLLFSESESFLTISSSLCPSSKYRHASAPLSERWQLQQYFLDYPGQEVQRRSRPCAVVVGRRIRSRVEVLCLGFAWLHSCRSRLRRRCLLSRKAPR